MHSFDPRYIIFNSNFDKINIRNVISHIFLLEDPGTLEDYVYNNS